VKKLDFFTQRKPSERRPIVRVLATIQLIRGFQSQSEHARMCRQRCERGWRFHYAASECNDLGRTLCQLLEQISLSGSKSLVVDWQPFGNAALMAAL
jgi:hypothetical protein